MSRSLIHRWLFLSFLGAILLLPVAVLMGMLQSSSSAQAAPGVGKAEYCVTGNAFYFNVELTGIPNGEVIFGIASDDFAFSGSDFERIAVNFSSPSGAIVSGPSG